MGPTGKCHQLLGIDVRVSPRMESPSPCNSIEQVRVKYMLASGFATVVGGTGLAVWNTPSHPSKAEQRAPYSSKSALKSFRFSDAFSSFFK